MLEIKVEVRSAASVEKATASHFDGLLAKVASRSMSLNKAAILKVYQACLLSTGITYWLKLSLYLFISWYKTGSKDLLSTWSLCLWL